MLGVLFMSNFAKIKVLKYMAKNFDTEIKESFDKKYLKVFLKNISIIEEVQEQLSKLQSVKNINITDSKSKNNPSLTLTVYPNRVFSIEEMREEVISFLESYFKGTPQIVSIRPRACFFSLFSFLPLWLHYNLNPLCVQY